MKNKYWVLIVFLAVNFDNFAEAQVAAPSPTNVIRESKYTLSFLGINMSVNNSTKIELQGFQP